MWLRSKNTYTEKEINLLIASIDIVLNNETFLLLYIDELKELKQKLLNENVNIYLFNNNI